MALDDFNRRGFLRATGITMALPMLESLQAETKKSDLVDPKSPAKRFIAVGSNLGLYRPAFNPKETGRNYKASELLSHVDKHRNDYTVISGLDHEAPGTHKNWDNFLCGKSCKGYSLDQMIADKIGHQTRYASFQLCAGAVPNIQKMCFNKNNVPLPLINRPTVIYKRMFKTKEEIARTDYLLKIGKSSLDRMLEETKRFKKDISGVDREKMDEYLTSVRDLEKRMGRQLNHLKSGPVKVDYKMPPYDPIAPSLMMEAQDMMYDLMALALQTDSTRVATMFLAGLGQVFTIDGYTLQTGYHMLSHHGRVEKSIRELIKIECEHMKKLSKFLDQLKQKKDAHGKPLLDSTIVMFGTGMGDASGHNNRDLPLLIAGGGFKHGSHIKNNKKHVLGDLFITLQNQLGIKAKSFKNATNRMAI